MGPTVNSQFKEDKNNEPTGKNSEAYTKMSNVRRLKSQRSPPLPGLLVAWKKRDQLIHGKKPPPAKHQQCLIQIMMHAFKLGCKTPTYKKFD